MATPQGHLTIKSINVGNAILNDTETVFPGNVTISGSLTASSLGVENYGIPNLEIPIGVPMIPFSTDIDLNLTSTLKCPDAFQYVDSHLRSKLYNSPPAPSLVSSNVTTTTIDIVYSLLRVRTGFLDTSLPHVENFNIEIVEDPHPFTIGSPGYQSFSGTPDCLHAIFHVSGGTNTESGGVAHIYNITSETVYNVRISATNYSNFATNYLAINTVSTINAGKPVSPLFSTITPSLITWTPPTDNDDITIGNNSEPPILNYRFTAQPVSSTRYPSIYSMSDIINTTSGTSIVPSLFPGTLFDISIEARNTVNATYSAPDTSSVQTPEPANPPAFSTISLNMSGGASGKTLANATVNNIFTNVYQVQTVYTSAFDIGPLGNLTVNGSLVYTTTGFPALGNVQVVDSPYTLDLVDQDHYTGSSSGFRKSATARVSVDVTGFALGSLHTISVNYDGHTNNANYYLDQIAAPVVSNQVLQSSNISWVTGIPMANSATVRFNVSNLIGNYLHANNLHASIRLEIAGSPVSSNVTIERPTATYYDTLGSLTTLTLNAPTIQFRDNVLSVTGPSAFGNLNVATYGNNILGTGAVNTAPLNLFTDYVSMNTIPSNLMNPGTVLYPPGPYTALDHTDDATSISQLPFIQGEFSVDNVQNFSDRGGFDYSSMTDGYVMFHFTGSDVGIVSGTREKLRIVLGGASGLVIDTATPGTENHVLQVKAGSTGWLDACNVIELTGLGMADNGTKCLSASSTNSVRDCYIYAIGPTDDIYIRVGLDSGKSFQNVTCEALVSF